MHHGWCLALFWSFSSLPAWVISSRLEALNSIYKLMAPKCTSPAQTSPLNPRLTCAVVHSHLHPTLMGTSDSALQTWPSGLPTPSQHTHISGPALSQHPSYSSLSGPSKYLRDFIKNLVEFPHFPQSLHPPVSKPSESQKIH